ncbi:MAG: hypothetical protein WC156_08840 [Pedobacter sp.]
MSIRKPYQILLLCFLVLMVYYPTLTAEVSLVDDQEMLNGMFNSDPVSLTTVFLPQVENGGYYRPFVGLSYYLDRMLWDLDVRSMHLDNIVMHLINVLLLFYIAGIVNRNRQGINSYLPFVAAALFALHPIATESVNWISGRTDPLAGNFVLLTAALLMLYRLSGLKRYLLSAAICIFLGVLSKESSFGMFLASWFILHARNDCEQLAQTEMIPGHSSKSSFRAFGWPFLLIVFSVITIEVLYVGNYWLALAGCAIYYAVVMLACRGPKVFSGYHLKSILFFLACLISTAAFYIILRKIVFRSDAGKIGHTLKLMLLDMGYSISLFLGATGFYFKKFILPLPLNFYILEIDPLYDLAGILLLLICLRLLTRLNSGGAFFIAGFCMLLPALPFAFGTIAWTGYAERYIYSSSAFWIISALIYIDANPPLRRLTTNAYLAVIAAVILFFSWQTYSRNVVWQKNVTLLEDTVSKSPKARRLRDMYMYALNVAGDIDGAKRQYAIANSLYSIKYDENADLIMAGILANEGKHKEALELYETVINKTNRSSAVAIKQMTRHLEIMLKDEKNLARRSILINKIKESDLLLDKISTDPMVFYNLGKKALDFNDKKIALGYFIRANSAFAINSPYRDFSAKLVEHLKQEGL